MNAATEAARLDVAIVGCGLIGSKRAAALGPDRLVACHDAVPERAASLARVRGGSACATLDDLLAGQPDVVVVATTNDALASIARLALEAGSHVLVEKPAGRTVAEVDAIETAAAAAGRLVKVGFNHRFHPGLARAVEEARSGRHGDILFVRARYGHGGRVGYEREWRARPEVSGGGELIDQGTHLLDLIYWLFGPQPLFAAFLRTSFWEMPVEDNAVVVLGDPNDATAAWSLFHVSWSEWKNEFAFEIYCRRAKLQVSGLGGSYGVETLRVFSMSPEMGPPELEEVQYGPEDGSWAAEWAHFREAVLAGRGRELAGDLRSARYCAEVVAEAYESAGYPVRSSEKLLS